MCRNWDKNSLLLSLYFFIEIIIFIKTFYMREIKGYIKFKDKKAIMKPLENQEGPVITWEINENHNSKDYFTYKGVRYQFVSSVEPKK